jgi:plastocyanin
MIARVLGAALVAAILLPATAHAAVTRAIQSVSTPTRLYWYPNQVPAQQGDTIEWRMTEPGNPDAATHDVWLIKPGADPSTAVQLGATYLGDGTAHALVDQVGTYTFYCSIHGGLAPGGMNGTITVGTTDPGPPVDPGQPWNDGGGDGGDDGNAWPNPTTAPTVFEEGDNTPPTLTLVSSSLNQNKRTLKLVVDNTDGVQIAYSVNRRKKVVDSGVQTAVPGQNTVKVQIPARPGDYTVDVWSIDDVDLESDHVQVIVTSRAQAARVKRVSPSVRGSRVTYAP